MKKDHSRLKAALISVVLALLVGAIIILILGKNPLSAYYNLLQGCGLAPKAKYAGGKSMLTDFSSFVNYWTPMIFAALAVTVAYNCGLFNIGVSGQMMTAGFIASITVGYSILPAGIAKPLVVLIGIVVGALIGALIGFLKYKFNINEVVSSIMINYTASYIISFFINSYYVDPVSRQSTVISAESRLTLSQIQIGACKYDIPLGFILAVLAVIGIKFLMDRTVLGYELKAVGTNRKGARYAGISVGRSMMLSMAISGGLAGLAGVTYYLGYFASIQPKALPSMGFDAIAVCLLGGIQPVGVFIASFLIQIISKGTVYMSSQAGLESEIASVITGIILLYSACAEFTLGQGRALRERIMDRINARRKADTAELQEAARKAVSPEKENNGKEDQQS